VKPRLKLSRKTTIYVVFGVIALLLIVPIPINIEAPALEIMYADPSHIEERTVAIRGWFSFNVIVGRHSFRGTIAISGYPETDSDLLFPVRLHYRPFERWNLWGTRDDLLFYVDGRELTPLSSSPIKVYIPDVFGVIHTTPFFRQTMINVRNDDRPLSLSESPVIVLNAATRADALLVLLRNRYLHFYRP